MTPPGMSNPVNRTLNDDTILFFMDKLADLEIKQNHLQRQLSDIDLKLDAISKSFFVTKGD